MRWVIGATGFFVLSAMDIGSEGSYVTHILFNLAFIYLVINGVRDATWIRNWIWRWSEKQKPRPGILQATRPPWCPDPTCTPNRNQANSCSGLLLFRESHQLPPDKGTQKGYNTHSLCLENGLDNGLLRLNVNRYDLEVIRWHADGMDGRRTSIGNEQGLVSVEENEFLQRDLA